MFWIFLSLGIVDGFFLLGAAALGFLGRSSADPQTHVAAGFLASVFTVFVHSLPFVYFMGSNKSLQEAVARHGLNPSLLEPIPKLRHRAFPWAWSACSAAAAAAILGGGSWTGFLPGWIHAVAGLLAVAVAWAALPFELRSIGENGRVIERTQSLIQAIPTGAAEREVEEHLGTIPLGKGLLLTGCSVWALFAYMKFIMKEEVEPFPWFALISAVLIVSGTVLMKKKPGADPRGSDEASRSFPPRP